MLLWLCYPELLLIDKAVIDPATGLFLAGYDGTTHWGWLAFLFARLALALYLVSSALSAYDHKALNIAEIIIRLAVAVLILFRLSRRESRLSHFTSFAADQSSVSRNLWIQSSSCIQSKL